jgi:hypothetical protein
MHLQAHLSSLPWHSTHFPMRKHTTHIHTPPHSPHPPPLTSLTTSSELSSSPPGVSSTPSSGIQYRQRKLQRSVREIRR